MISCRGDYGGKGLPHSQDAKRFRYEDDGFDRNVDGLEDRR